MTVNELARRAGIPAHIVRYYTQCGLLSPARNARNAYRDYDETALRRLRFICNVKKLGFTLTEIGMILDAADADGVLLPAIRDLMELRARLYQEELASALQLQQTILEVIEQWDRPDGDVPQRVKLQRFIERVALDDRSGSASQRRD